MLLLLPEWFQCRYLRGTSSVHSSGIVCVLLLFLLKKDILEPEKYNQNVQEEADLRHVEKDVLIPKMMREKARELCSDKVQAFTKCCQDAGILMVVKCQEENTALKKCLTAYSGLLMSEPSPKTSRNVAVCIFQEYLLEIENVVQEEDIILYDHYHYRKMPFWNLLLKCY
ncbi:COX assembly mitochondrial protein homolog isoform X2 [Hemicordylus capensis]|uniref:COX assembly mitochondrial protein homolog isoform X2 n=1 Tax=Hemicordylus capensis TaxID=884348 RepID=UPI002303C804|nr:COX assembly mitochondrial protein homolog isoform X2 [Hemicordylus capensis]XP_053120786.1 COX assembly mitochondrial protein homolog isoform X2 [Hemicordylus capensis]XP_053120787.1 COX assembly mitochondrial protein homolog isoform X2 [Hemicordylus capensis]